MAFVDCCSGHSSGILAVVPFCVQRWDCTKSVCMYEVFCNEDAICNCWPLDCWRQLAGSDTLNRNRILELDVLSSVYKS